MNVLLCVVIVVLGLGVFIGYKQGLIKMIASLLVATLVVSLVSFISPYISKWIQQKTPIKETIQNKVVEILVPGDDEEAGENILEKELVREEQISLLENAKIPEMFRQSLLENNNHEAYAMLGVESFGEYVGAYIAKVISDLLAFVISFVVVIILAIVLVKVLGIVDKLPLIGGVNRVAGGALGTVIGIMAIWILFLIITIFYDTSIGQACFEQISQSKVLGFLYDGNILMKYVTRF